MKEITEKNYMDLAQNGARVLFDLGNYRVLDGVKGDSESYFIKDFSTNKWYTISMETCYELVTAFHCGGHKPFVLQCIDEIVLLINTKEE